jgi:phosphomevalonate decarboxylase
MKASARAHPIQGLIKYHGLRNPALNIPYHDSISVCTAPSETRTTVAFGYEADTCRVDESPIDDEGFERVTTVLDLVREWSGIESHARVISENNFESNIGLGASASAFAALALAAAEAAGLDLSRKELSRLARRGSTSAARSVIGGFSYLHTNEATEDCVAEQVPDTYEEDVRIIAGIVPKYKRTSRAHLETPQSHLFCGRLAHIHSKLMEMRTAIRRGDFEATFELAERDSLNLLAVTMTGPEGWIYWQPETLKLLQLARRLRETGIPVYFSSDTGAAAYLNTTAEYADEVSDAVEELGVESRTWHIGRGVESLDHHLF